VEIGDEFMVFRLGLWRLRIWWFFVWLDESCFCL